MGHVKLKASKEIKIDFNPKELDNIEVPEESKKIAIDYLTSKKLVDEQQFDILLLYEDKVLFGFDYLHNKVKRLVVEINPVTIFYSNAVMSYGMLNHYKDILLSQSPDMRQIEKAPAMNLTHCGMYFQLAINCIINLQATLESFANRIIPEDYPYLDKNGEPVVRTITYKLYNVLPKVKSMDFHLKKHKKHNISIDKLINLRNHIIHLKPTGETNTGYKGVYRDLMDFDYAKAILSVKTFVNFYEPSLIEECACGKDFYFDSGQKI